MVSKIIFLRPKRRADIVRNGQNQRVETLQRMFIDFGFPVLIVEVPRFPTLRDYRTVSSLQKTSNSILAVTSFILLPWCLTPLGKKKIKIVDMMDSLIRTRSYSHQGFLRWVIGRIESSVSLSFKVQHIRTYISEYDRESDEKVTPKKIETFVIPNAITISNPGPASNLKRLVFVGDLNYFENRLMLCELCEVLDKAKIKLNIYGAGESLIQRKFKNHIFHGSREDLELYQLGDLHLAPVRNLHGLNSKVFNAISRGIPVLTTSNGANGINECPGLYIENDVRNWPKRINEIFLRSQESPLEVHWNGFGCDDHEKFRIAMINLLGDPNS